MVLQSNTNTDEMRKKVILAVGAHPDDMDFGASGTIAKWVEEGASAYYLILTDGSRGSSDSKMTHKKLAAIRKKEQEGAGRILGLKKIFFLNHTDTQLIADFSLKEEISRVIKTVRPNIVITMDPTFYYSQKSGFVNHTDHRAAALATFVAHHLEQGVSLVLLSKVLGHKRLSTTERYLEYVKDRGKETNTLLEL